MTPASMLRVLYGLIHGNSLLTSSQRQQMDSNCLGWDCSLTGTASYVAKEATSPTAQRPFIPSSASSRARSPWW